MMITIMIIWNWVTLVTPQTLDTSPKVFNSLLWRIFSPRKKVCSYVDAVQSLTLGTSQNRSINLKQSVLLIFLCVLNLFHLIRALLVHEFPLETSETSRRFTSVHRSKLFPPPLHSRRVTAANSASRELHVSSKRIVPLLRLCAISTVAP
jgi:hypothetical protein